MKVLQINAVYGHGSTGVIVRDIEKACENAGIDCYIAGPDNHAKATKHSYVIGDKCDYKIHALMSRIAGKSAYFSKHTTIKFLKYINSIAPDVIHLHNLHSNYINLNMLLQYIAGNNIRTIITLHDCWFFTGGCFHYTSANCNRWKFNCGHCPKRLQDTPAYIYDASSSILKDRIKYFSAIPDLTFVGASKWIADELSKSKLKKAGNITYIHNGFDLNVFYPRKSNLREKLGLADKKIILGPASKWLQTVNRETLSFFANNLPANYILLLFGCNTPIRNLPSNIQTYGFTNSREEMAELYSLADVMVNCSREDTLSSINIEAQACGTPVVTYDATGSKETVNNTSSFAVETGNYRKLFNMAITASKTPITQKECHDFVSTYYNAEKNYKDYLALYTK